MSIVHIHQAKSRQHGHGAELFSERALNTCDRPYNITNMYLMSEKATENEEFSRGT